MASARTPLPPLVVIDHPDQPISSRQRAAWWRVAADLQRLARHKIAQEGATPPRQGTAPRAQETTAKEPTFSPPQFAD